jgi:membrane associated rhomboid family serine protease
MVFTLLVAVLCSLGVGTHWEFSVVVGVGGIAGRIVARRELGYLLGGLYGTVYAVIGLGLVMVAFSLVSDRESLLGETAIIALVIMLGGTIFGGIWGGIIAREPPGK